MESADAVMNCGAGGRYGLVAAFKYVISEKSDHPLILRERYLNWYMTPLTMPLYRVY